MHRQIVKIHYTIKAHSLKVLLCDRKENPIEIQVREEIQIWGTVNNRSVETRGI